MTRYIFQKPRISSGYYSGAVSYDRDGRLVADSTRHIAAVEYEAWGGLLPRTVDMGADKLHLRYRPDGRLALRQHARRYMEIYRDSRGNVRQRWRTALDTRTYRGSFELHGSRWLYHTDCGFITLADGTPHYYARDYQGSTRAVYTPLLAEISPLSVSPTAPEPYIIEQATDYYPSGLPVDVTATVSGGAATAATTDRLHIGNRWIDHAGLGWYDNTARYHDAILARFTAPDPLEYKYPSLSPYTHCAANPANLTDPTGQEIVILGEDDISYNVILAEESNNYRVRLSFDDHFVDEALTAINTLAQSGKVGASLVQILHDSDKTIYIQKDNKNNPRYSPVGRTIHWNSNFSLNVWTQSKDNTLHYDPIPSSIILGHEMFHAEDDISGWRNNSEWYRFNDASGNKVIVNRGEYYAMKGENYLRAAMGLNKRVYYHGGQTRYEPSSAFKGKIWSFIFNHTAGLFSLQLKLRNL